MPTYEYRCTKCGHTFEAFQRMSEEPLSRCPKCKGAVRRMIGGGMAVIFKGSGFYITDNKRSSSLTSGGNGSSKEKNAEKPVEAARDTSVSTEKKPAS